MYMNRKYTDLKSMLSRSKLMRAWRIKPAMMTGLRPIQSAMTMDTNELSKKVMKKEVASQGSS